MKYTLTVLFALICSAMFAQISEPYNGTKEDYEPIYAFKNATIYLDSENKLENATLIIQGDEILEVGKGLVIKKGAIVKDCSGMTIYPAFIDMYSSYGVPKLNRKEWKPTPQINSLKKGSYYWNESIKPEMNASDLFIVNEKNRKKMLQYGFGVVNTHQQDGIARGTSATVNLSKDQDKSIILNKSAQNFSLQKGVSFQTYPSSQMGSIALLKQFYQDYIWYKSNNKQGNLSIDKQIENEDLIAVMSVNDKLEVVRADKIGDEFGIQYVIKSSGNEYQRLSDIKETKAPLIIPINFPKGIKVSSSYEMSHIPLSTLKHWELAPSNPYFLEKNNIPFTITSDGTKSAKEFLGNLRLAIERGLSVKQAIYSLTLYPAQLLKIDTDYGTLQKGKKANFIISEGDLLTEKKSKILENWNLGIKEEISPEKPADVSATYSLSFKDNKYELSISEAGPSVKGKLTYIQKNIDSTTMVTKTDTIKAPVAITKNRNHISLSFLMKNDQEDGILYLSGTFETKFGIMDGDGLDSKGKSMKWSAIKNASKTKKKSIETSKKVSADTLSEENIWFPNMAYGLDSLSHEAKPYLIRNASIWTNEEQGILSNADLLIQDGKILKVGQVNGAIPKNTIVIDAKGKHVTSGIIDEHSHIAISKGVNESGQAITAEVSIADVVNSYDVDIYRQLAGGVTTSQLLHGSANPIGGQSALIKLKWGQSPQEMLYKDAPKFIKFALGENVKQTNWGDYNTVRFPQTRMGVEQVYYQAFKKAKAYKAKHETYNKLSEKKKSKAQKPAVDYEMDVLNEILDEKRFITCHSYIQSEINMLMKVADSMGFRLNTFTHILEGYKVADKMIEHGAGGSTFADWWAYKYEVNDAIPYNATMLNEMGIVTAINSDDAEMARRLNQEAGKIVKYGGTSQQDAWKMVTLNPAKLLHIDDKVGSIKIGKDADIVIWSDNPLSVNAKVEKTFVEGVLLYDMSKDKMMMERNQQEKARILSKMNADKGPKTKFKPKKKGHYHCDTIEQL